MLRCLRSLSLVLIIAGALTSACGGDDDAPPACTSPSDCGGARCIDGACVAIDAAIEDVGVDTSVDASADVSVDAPLDAEEDTGPRLANWILSVANERQTEGEPSYENFRLLQINVAEENFGATTTICESIELPDSIPALNNISSLTFNDNKLYATARGEDFGDTLLLINPCTCEATRVGAYGYSRVAGITSNGAQDMFGISGAEDVALTMSPETAMAELLAELEDDWGTVGLTWTGPGRDSLWGIDGNADNLVELSAVDGSQGEPIPLDFNFGSVGMEYHPGQDVIYACSSDGHLLIVDPETGHVTVGPELGYAPCNNLAAPFGPVACII